MFSGFRLTVATKRECASTGFGSRHRHQWRLAGKRRYIPPALVENVRGIEVPTAVSGEAAIRTPMEMRTLLAAAKPHLIPALAIGGFAGLRTAEIARLGWRDIRIEEGVIILTATKTKTASRRVVPILPNLSEWLKPHQCESGAVSQAATANQLSIQFARTSKRAGFDWLPNACVIRSVPTA